jgi:hypothetical protein
VSLNTPWIGALFGDGLTFKAQKTVSMVRFVTKEKTGKKWLWLPGKARVVYCAMNWEVS